MNASRRTILVGAAAGLLRAQPSKRQQYRVALIGATGRGDYGHDWDLAWNAIPQAKVVAVADASETGRNRAIVRSRAERGYSDYREMIEREKPDIVGICPRWLDQRRAMFLAAAASGAHILMEKPFAPSLEDADAMVKAADEKGVKVQVGHTARIAGVTQRVAGMLREGAIGDLIEMRARGKEDKRAGGEDLMVLGTHTFDLMRLYAGDPQWVFAHVTQNGQEVRPSMMHQGTEPIGLIGGDQVAAMFEFPHDLHGYFGSKRSEDTTGRRFGVSIYGSRGVIFVPLYDVPSSPAAILRSETWVAGPKQSWEPIVYPSGTELPTREAANRAMALDLLSAIETKREPICSARDGRWTIEMTTGIYQSQMAGKPVTFPLTSRN